MWTSGRAWSVARVVTFLTCTASLRFHGPADVDMHDHHVDLAVRYLQ